MASISSPICWKALLESHMALTPHSSLRKLFNRLWSIWKPYIRALFRSIGPWTLFIDKSSMVYTIFLGKQIMIVTSKYTNPANQIPVCYKLWWLSQENFFQCCAMPRCVAQGQGALLNVNVCLSDVQCMSETAPPIWITGKRIWTRKWNIEKCEKAPPKRGA